MSEQKDRKIKGGVIVFGICAIIIIALLAAVIYLLTAKREENEPVKRNVVVNEKNVDEVISQLAEERTPPDRKSVV